MVDGIEPEQQKLWIGASCIGRNTRRRDGVHPCLARAGGGAQCISLRWRLHYACVRRPWHHPTPQRLRPSRKWPAAAASQATINLPNVQQCSAFKSSLSRSTLPAAFSYPSGQLMCVRIPSPIRQTVAAPGSGIPHCRSTSQLSTDFCEAS